MPTRIYKKSFYWSLFKVIVYVIKKPLLYKRNSIVSFIVVYVLHALWKAFSKEKGNQTFLKKSFYLKFDVCTSLISGRSFPMLRLGEEFMVTHEWAPKFQSYIIYFRKSGRAWPDLDMSIPWDGNLFYNIFQKVWQRVTWPGHVYSMEQEPALVYCSWV